LLLILVGYWAAFALYPLPEASSHHPGVPANWPHHPAGFAGHWDKNSNPAWAFDVWFLNLFPRERPFLANGGGYATLSFIPTLGTMILGLLAGGWLREDKPAGAKLLRLLLAGAACLALGWVLDFTGICPSVKRIWTPAWTLYSGGWCFLFLAGFYTVTEMLGWRGWAFPLVVIGANSIAIYCLVHLIDGFIIGSFRTHLGRNVFQFWGLLGERWPEYPAQAFEPFWAGAAALVVFWLILFWMYLRRIFIRI
jgi:predicted acyltransferase